MLIVYSQYTVCWIEKCSYSSWLRATLVSDGVYEVDNPVMGTEAIRQGTLHQLDAVKPVSKQKNMWKDYSNVS